ncbi:MAG: ATP-grasp domain-containing protein [Parabacteroides sp.]|nr:ATP-grasp domain-containing protein [Parabacteroides sp.]
MKKLAIIGGGVMASYFGESCQRLGFESHYFSMADGKVVNGKINFFHEVNIFDKDKIVEICREIGVDGVVATTELSVPITAYVANKLGLLGNSVDVANVITDKYRNRECIKDLTNLLSPKYVEIKDIDEIVNANISYPVILKPVCLGGKRGISVVKDASELLSAFNYATKSFREGVQPKIIVEQFLEDGMECSVESISFKGQHTIIQITQKDSSGAPHCVELGHHQPAPISAELWNKVVDGVSSGLTAIGLTNGPCHTEIKIIEDKVYLIEFNARPGGDHISWPMVELSTGFDFISAIVLAATGDLQPIDVSNFKHNYSGLYYVVKQTDYLKNIFDSCENESWCWEKNFITDELEELVQNDMEHTNYIIYSSETGDPIAKLLKDI